MRIGIFVVLVSLLAVGCTSPSPAPVAHTPGATHPSPSETSLPSATRSPSPTAEPLALTVNGEGISLADYQAELERYAAAQKALGKTLTAGDAAQAVQDELVNRALLAQAAFTGGFQVDDAALQARIDRLAGQIGGPEALAAWEKGHGYTDAGFRRALRVEIAAAWQRDQFTAQVPANAEQVHAREILVPDEAAAQRVTDRLKSGLDFATLAFKYDPETGGDLGWFPRGYIDSPEVEAAAFSLQPNEHNGPIQDQLGFHFVEVIERSQDRPLSSDARLVLKRKALAKWLQDQRAKSQVTLLVPE